MSEKEESFFNASNVLAIIALVIAIPYYLVATVFNPKLDVTDRILCLCATLPSLIYGIFYLTILVIAPVGFMMVCLASDAWPLGLMIGFFLLLGVIGLVKNLFS